MRSAIHEEFDRLEGARAPSNRVFAFALTVVLAVIGCFRLLRGGSIRWWALCASGAFLLLALLRPSLLHPLVVVWMKVSMRLGRIMTMIVMGLFFFLVITPFGLVRRIFTRDPLRLRMDPEAPSYWRSREPPGPTPESMANPF